ncbi:MAG: hypothetical protein ABL904_04040 [Hyphomicrobiaceae bacterium]
MPQPKLHVDNIKDQLADWIEQSIYRTMSPPRPHEGPGRAKLPPISEVWATNTVRSQTDETHVIAIKLLDGKVFSILVKTGDYTAVANDADVGKRSA